jgi:predicted GNAT family acetyltransferase
MTAKVSTNLNRSRYEIHVDSTLAGFADFEMEGAAMVLPHVVIEPAFGGQGLATTLIREVLDDARAQGVKVVPACTFVAAFIDKNPDYQDLVA